MTEAAPLNLVWMRRDLRLHDQAALAAACAEDGQIQPIFVFDTEVLARFDNRHDRRLSFLMAVVQDLHAQIIERGGGLLILHGKASEIIPRAAKALGASKLFAARDHEPATRARDKTVYAACQDQGCDMVAASDNFLQFAGSDHLLNKTGEPYKVFTPFARHWRNMLPKDAFAEKTVTDSGRYASIRSTKKALEEVGLTVLDPHESRRSLLEKIGYESADFSPWGIDEGRARLERFVQSRLSGYKDSRNIMADEAGTSRLSPYLRFGLISVRECARLAVEVEGLEGGWMNELIWRDFYAMILYRIPNLPQQEFYAKYQGMEWPGSDEHFQRWQAGETGYPTVDAAMRELLQTGWMHNRARMIVASFLTKHLLVDWRKGEAHFAQYLMDYELSSNVGGWQWAASTGIDPQPYFRIFNPITQGQKFDESGEYIARYIPQLAKEPAKHRHEPWKKSGVFGYPAPLIDHKEARQRALAHFKRY